MSPSSRLWIACEMTVLPFPGGPVDEHRVAGIHCWPELIQHLLADDEVRERLADFRPRDLVRCRSLERLHVASVLRERNRRDADVVVVLEEQHCPGTARVGDAVSVRGAAQGATRYIDVMLLFAGADHRFDDGNGRPRRRASSVPVSSPAKWSVLRTKLRYEVAREPGLIERFRRRYLERRVSFCSDHLCCSAARAACRACRDRWRAMVNEGWAAMASSNTSAASEYRP